MHLKLLPLFSLFFASFFVFYFIFSPPFLLLNHSYDRKQKQKFYNSYIMYTLSFLCKCLLPFLFLSFSSVIFLTVISFFLFYIIFILSSAPFYILTSFFL
ncbi:hypothetical protein BDC45DRAFT_497525 [Circinella umbellata]|nr:hypothetical protein BDC45DRAFT_497525 [Circinella umbellata]